MRTNQSIDHWVYNVIRIWGLGGSGGFVFSLIFIRSLAKKLSRLTLLHFGLITLHINFGKNPGSHYFHEFRIFDVTMKPKTNYVQLWRHQITSNASSKHPEYV